MGNTCFAFAAAKTPSGHHEFTYFKMYEYRGEPARIALHASGMPWKDTSIDDFAKYGKDKAAGKYSTGLPVLLTPSGKEYTQSIAIVRYAAKLGNSRLYPTDPESALAVDEIMDICQDAFSKIPQPPRAPQPPDLEALKAQRVEYANGKFKAYVDLLNAKLNASGGPYFAGQGLTIADIVAKYFVCETITRGEEYKMMWPDDFKLGKWPALAHLNTLVGDHPIVTSYRAWKKS